jgi:hypothetical protein
MRLPAVAWFVLLGLVAPCALAENAWTLTDARFRTSTIQLDSIDAQGIHPAGNSSGLAVVSWDDFLDLSRSGPASAATAGRFDLYLSGGDRISGEPVGLADDKLRWRSPILGELRLSSDRLLAIARTGAPPQGLEDARSDDMVRLSNGDVADGIVTQIGLDGVTLQAADATPTLGWDAIGAVLFSTPAGSDARGSRAFRVTFTDDTSITATRLSLVGGKLSLDLDAKTSRDVDLSAVTSIEQVNGPISWLTQHQPVQNIYRPFFAENFPTRFDRSVDGNQTIHGRFSQFHHGIGCHSYSKLVYDLDGTYAAFRTQFVVDSDSPLADVTVRILLDDKAVVERKNVKAGRIESPIVVPLNKAKKLALEVDYGENYATEGRFAWLDPALLRVMPPVAAPEPVTSAATQP